MFHLFSLAFVKVLLCVNNYTNWYFGGEMTAVGSYSAILPHPLESPIKKRGKQILRNPLTQTLLFETFLYMTYYRVFRKNGGYQGHMNLWNTSTGNKSDEHPYENSSMKYCKANGER